MYQNVTDDTFLFLDKELSRSIELYYIEPSLHPSITDTAEAMNTLFQERHNHNESFITIEMSRKTEKVKNHPANGRFCLAFSNTDLGHCFKSDIGSEFEELPRAERRHQPKLAYYNVGIDSFMIYQDSIEYQNVANTKIPLWH